MVVVSSLVQNAFMKNHENPETKFPYRILLDLSERLKVAEATITKMLAEREALECDKDDEVKNLKQRISELTHENNRYHLAISYCTVCAPDDADPEVPPLEVSIKASPPVSTSVDTLDPSAPPVPCSGVSSSDVSALSSTVPALMPGSVVKAKQTNTVVRRKDETFISRMVKILAKLEAKYRVPEHKRKKRLFTRKSKPSSIVPEELTSICHGLAAPGPFGTMPGYKTSLGVVTVLATPVAVYYPETKRWVLFAEHPSPPSAGRGTRRGGTPPARRRKRKKRRGERKEKKAALGPEVVLPPTWI